MNTLKKCLVIICVMLLSAVTISAQTTKVYGTINYEVKTTLDKKAAITVTLGQIVLPESAKLVDNDGLPLLFETMLDAMNYMSQLGWKFEAPYVWALGNGGVILNQNCWIISKEVPESDIIKNVNEPSSNVNRKTKKIENF